MSTDLHTAIVYALKNDATVAGLVSTRIYPAGRVEQGAVLPYITIQKIDNLHTNHQSGSSSLAHARFQVDGWASTRVSAFKVYEAVKDVLDNFTGSLGDPSDPVDVKHAILDSDREDFLPPADASGRGAYRASMDFLFWHAE